MSRSPADPAVNATVFASAGTGKTWLLVTRLLRLLLAGARPEGILAVTFTRDAAAEMRLRLVERLRGWQALDDAALRGELAGIGLPDVDEALTTRARALYEEILFAPQGVRTTTFHAFCQDLLRRFPLEADVPPGFEIADNAAELFAEARDALYGDAAMDPEDRIAQALETLFEETGTADSAEKTLKGFLNHRSDWWAWTADEADPVAFAEARLRALLSVDEDADPVGGFVAAHRDRLVEYAALLGRNTPSDMKLGDALSTSLDRLSSHPPGVQKSPLTPAPLPSRERGENTRLFETARGVLLTQDNAPRKRKESDAQRKRLGDAGEARLLELHAILSAAMLDTLDLLARRRNLVLNRAWFLAGHRLVEHFQRIKAERRVLDYTDLEWRACRMLNEGEHALWVQYKLDARIDHLLVDEFQDTNPTQWRLLLPLLEEMAAGDPERARSVFLVGDTKQSIYGFRRARPELQDAADAWLRERIGGQGFSLDKSWRSSPAVLDVVNLVFGKDTTLGGRLSHFDVHGTHRAALWGRVEVWPAAVAPEAEAPEPAAALRDPLESPRAPDAPSAHAIEAETVAVRIESLVLGDTVIGEGARARRPDYGDIMILVRKRTHVREIERALRRAQIPYIAAERGTLLSQIEVDDLVKLLTVLVAPFDDLALAQVLRSPLFSVRDDDLARLATAREGSWWKRLQTISTEVDPASALGRAARLLDRWRALAGRLPIHDLLDRVFHEGDVLARYRAASLPHRRAQAEAALVRFLELALEVDSGRYPSLSRFLARVATLRMPGDGDAPDAPPQRGADRRVRIMTVHGSKGLQAPIVFLCDAHFPEEDRTAWGAVVEWPANEARPSQMLLAPRKDDCCRAVDAMLAGRRTEEARERANLLYVALTRAEQMLFVTAARGKKSAPGSWHEDIRRTLEGATVGTMAEDGVWSHEFGVPPPSPPTPTQESAAEGRIPIASPSGRRWPEGPDEGRDRRLQVQSRQQESLRRSLPAGERGLESSGHTPHPNPLPKGEGILGSMPTLPEGEGMLGSAPAVEDTDVLRRGIAIHRFLDLLTAGDDPGDTPRLRRVAAELGLAAGDPELAGWLAEARTVVADPALADLFDPARHDRAWNEVPIAFRDAGGGIRSGVMDRLVRRGDSLLIVDYKTHRIAGDPPGAVVAQYREQMARYRKGAERLWPGLRVDCALLFTASRRLARIEDRA